MSPPSVAKPSYWTINTLRRRRKTNGRSKFHHRLIEIARILPTEDLLRRLPHARTRNFGSPEQARDDALNIPVHYGNRFVKCNTGDRCRGISTDARKGVEFDGSRGKFAGMIANDHSGCGMQVSRSSVVSQAAPLSQYR